MIGADYSRPSMYPARLWGSVAAAFILAPLFCYGFARIFDRSVLVAIPAVTIALLVVSFLFGLWKPAVGTGAKVGVVLWAVAMACLSPVTLLVGLMYSCAILNVQGGHFHYVCGL